MKEKLDILQDIISNQQKTINAFYERIIQLETSLSKSNTENERLLTEKHELEKISEAKAAELKKTTDNYAEISEKINKQIELLEKARKRANEAEESYNKKSDELDENLDAEKKKTKAANESLKEKINEYDNLKIDSDNKSEEIKKLEAIIAELQKEISGNHDNENVSPDSSDEAKYDTNQSAETEKSENLPAVLENSTGTDDCNDNHTEKEQTENDINILLGEE